MFRIWEAWRQGFLMVSDNLRAMLTFISQMELLSSPYIMIPLISKLWKPFEGVFREEPGEAVCYFNDKSYKTGNYVKSGTSILKCVYGIWVPAGSSDPDNP